MEKSRRKFNGDGWLVVLFMDENCVATIPESWLLKSFQSLDYVGASSLQFCYWPPKTQNALPLIKKKEMPQKTWPKYKIKILGKYDDFAVAQRKSLLAEETTDLSVVKRSTRKRKTNFKYLSSTSSSDDYDSQIRTKKRAISKVPESPKSSKDSDNLAEFSETSYIITNSANFVQEPIETNLAMSSIKIEESSNNVSSQNLHFSDVNKPEATAPPTHHNNESGILDVLNQILAKQSLNTSKLTHIQQQLDEIKIRINQQKYNLIDDNLAVNNVTSERSLAELLPISNEETLNNLDIILESHGKAVAKELSRIGGNTTKEITKRVMYRLFTNQFGQLYSWEGGKGKRVFKKLKIAGIIKDAVRCNKRTFEACDDEIISVIKIWLAKAKERHLNELKRTK